MSTCVLFQTAMLHPSVIGEFTRMQRECGRDVDLRLLLDVAALSPEQVPRDLPVSTFDSRDFATWGYRTFGDRMVPGHTHFPLLRFAEQVPEHTCYWMVEYDVRFTGSWRAFHDKVAAFEADFLTCHVRRHRDEPDWPWWRSLSRGDERVPADHLLRSFNTVLRLSRAALHAVRGFHAEGWTGHHEVLLPTLLHRAGLRVMDLGGTGPFTPAALRGRLYSSYSTRDGSLNCLGTMRFRPVRHAAGLLRDRLYHPVKPAGTYEPTAPRELLRQTLIAVERHARWRARRALDRVRPHVSRHS
jgi:hypothetical protein